MPYYTLFVKLTRKPHSRTPFVNPRMIYGSFGVVHNASHKSCSFFSSHSYSAVKGQYNYANYSLCYCYASIFYSIEANLKGISHSGVRHWPRRTVVGVPRYGAKYPNAVPRTWVIDRLQPRRR